MFTFAKGFVYKFCFCLGLGTATYYSYGQVQKWVHHDEVKVIENVVEKHVTRENTVYDQQSPQEFSYEQPVVAAPLTAVEDQKAIEPPPAVAATEEKKEEEKKDENGEKKDENAEEVAGGVMMNQPQAYPMAYSPQSGPAPASTERTAEAPETQNIPLLPNALPTPSSSGGITSTSSGSSGFIPTPGALDANDIAALIAPMKASFDDQMYETNGLLCVVGGHNCERKNHVPVHSLRWGQTEGLKKDVKFTIKSAGATSLEFNFEFKIQNMGLVEENISVSARPIETLVSRDAKNNRVIEFRFPDLTVRGEVISHVQATMVYEVTANGLVLSNESVLSFSRAKVDTLVTKWEPLAGEPTIGTPIAVEQTELARRVPAAQTGVFLIADELDFSMSIEKSQ